MLGMIIILKIENLIIKNMNTIIKDLKKKEAVNCVNYIKSSNYNTNYSIIDNNKLILDIRRDPCFREIFTGAKKHLLKFSKNSKRKLVIYCLEDQTALTDSEIKSYIRYLRQLQIPFTFKIIEDYDLNFDSVGTKDEVCYTINDKEEYFKNIKVTAGSYYNNDITLINSQGNPQRCSIRASRLVSIKDGNKLRCFKKQKAYVIILDFNKVNLVKTKIISYFFRYIYETSFDLIIKATLKYKKKHPKEDFFRIFQLFNSSFCNKRLDDLVKYLGLPKNTEHFGASGHIIGWTSNNFNTNIKSILEYIKNCPEDSSSVVNSIFSNKKASIRFDANNGWGMFNRDYYFYPRIDETIDKGIERALKLTNEDLSKEVGYKIENQGFRIYLHRG